MDIEEYNEFIRRHSDCSLTNVRFKMKLKGFIKSVVPALDVNGNQRCWTSPAGECFEFFTAKVEIPHVGNNGQVYNDVLLADVVRSQVGAPVDEAGNPVPPYKSYLNSPKPLELTLLFSVREQEGKRPWMGVKLTNAALLVE